MFFFIIINLNCFEQILIKIFVSIIKTIQGKLNFMVKNLYSGLKFQVFDFIYIL